MPRSSLFSHRLSHWLETPYKMANAGGHNESVGGGGDDDSDKNGGSVW